MGVVRRLTRITEIRHQWEGLTPCDDAAGTFVGARGCRRKGQFDHIEFGQRGEPSRQTRNGSRPCGQQDSVRFVGQGRAHEFVESVVVGFGGGPDPITVEID